MQSDTTVLAWDLAAAPIQPLDAAKAWADLTGADGMKADRAMRALLSDPAAADTFSPKKRERPWHDWAKSRRSGPALSRSVAARQPGTRGGLADWGANPASRLRGPR